MKLTEQKRFHILYSGDCEIFTSFRPDSKGEVHGINFSWQTLALVMRGAKWSVLMTGIEGLVPVLQVLLETTLWKWIDESSDITIWPSADPMRHDMCNSLFWVVGLAMVDTVLAIAWTVGGLEPTNNFGWRRLKNSIMRIRISSVKCLLRTYKRCPRPKFK